MKRILLSVATVVAMAAPAVAADMRAPVMKAPPIGPVMSWTGCYLSGGGGYGMWNQDVTSLNNNLRTDHDVTNGGRGWFGTVGGGCDLQVSGSWVVGIFADYDFSGADGDAAVPVSGASYAGSEKMRSAWSVGGRIGYLITPSVLTYFSGGFTEARFGAVDLTLTLTSATTPTYTVGAHTYSGWFLGGGYEYNLSWLPGLFWKTEYRFAQYETDNLPLLVYGTGAATTRSIDSQKFVQTIRSQLVWRFNWGR
jgi:outer membrane immunogenic protein